MTKAEWKKKVCMRVSIRVCSSVPGGAAWHTTGGVLVCAGMFTTARISACGQGRVSQGVFLYELRACALSHGLPHPGEGGQGGASQGQDAQAQEKIRHQEPQGKNCGKVRLCAVPCAQAGFRKRTKPTEPTKQTPHTNTHAHTHTHTHTSPVSAALGRPCG